MRSGRAMHPPGRATSRTTVRGNGGVGRSAGRVLLLATSATAYLRGAGRRRRESRCPRFPGLRAGSPRIPSRGESRGFASCPRGRPCSTVGAAPPLTRTRSQSRTKQSPAECRRALLQLVQGSSRALLIRDACSRRKGAPSLGGSHGRPTVLAAWWEHVPVAGGARVRPHS
jgi:hypothetical protein